MVTHLFDVCRFNRESGNLVIAFIPNIIYSINTGIEKYKKIGDLLNAAEKETGYKCFEKLVGLKIRNNLFTEITCINIFKNLTILDLSNNNLELISGLEELVKLKELILSNNNIKKIENLDNLTNLVTLGLNNNPICKLENLDNLVRLEWLSLMHTCIEIIEGLDNNINLCYLNARKNNIKHIGIDTSRLKRFKMIFLSSCPLENILIEQFGNLSVESIKNYQIGQFTKAALS